MNIKNLFTKFNLRNWIPYWKDDVGDSIIDEMGRRGVPANEFRNFYVTYGAIQLEFMEKLITERIKRGDIDKMGKFECAFLGVSELHEFMKQIVVELDLREETSKAENQKDREEEEAKK